MHKRPKVLFLSTGTSTRGQIAEGFLAALAGEHFQAVSAGIVSGDVHPLAIEVMREAGIDISGQEPKSVAESLKDHFTYVIVVYDSAKERSPIFPFTTRLLRWSHADPSAALGSPAETKEAFRRVRDEIRKNIHGFVNDTVWRQQPLPKAA